MGDPNKPVISKLTYKETVLTITGSRLEGISEIGIDDDTMGNDLNPQNRWYKKDNDQQKSTKEFDPCPIIPISKEDFEEWCKLWKNNTFIVKLLGRRVGWPLWNND
ncbi:hypothetical protein AHAS_Ahas05G0016600 [Arachis hypogaea]